MSRKGRFCRARRAPTFRMSPEAEASEGLSASQHDLAFALSRTRAYACGPAKGIACSRASLSVSVLSPDGECLRRKENDEVRRGSQDYKSMFGCT